MMRFERTYVFLIRFLIILIIFLGITIIVNSLVDFSTDEKKKATSFLCVSENLVDSVILTLSIDQKLDIIFQPEIPDSILLHKEENKNSENQQDSNLDKRTIKQNNLKTKSSRLKDFYFAGVDRHLVLNSITDSVFIAEYLLSEATTNDSLAYCFVNLKFSPFEFQNLNDTLFVDFYIKRFAFLKQSCINHSKLLGLKVNTNQLSDFISSHSNSISAKKFYFFLQNDLDMILLDSFSVKQPITFNFNGLFVAKLVDRQTLDDKEILAIFKSSPDIFLVNKINRQLYKDKLSALVKANQLSEQELNNKIRKAIKAMIWMDLGKSSSKYIENEYHTKEYYASRLSQMSIVLLNNPDSLLPVKNIHNKQFTIVWIGQTINYNFRLNSSNYVQTKILQLIPGKTDWEKKIAKLAKNSFCIYVLDTLLSDTFDISQFKKLTAALDPKSAVVLNFKNYNNLKFVTSKVALIQLQSKNQTDYGFAAQAIFGGIAMQGQLPLSIDRYLFGHKKLSLQTRLKYSIAEEVGIDLEKLNEIDLIANDAIANGAFPGCQVFIAKNGQVVYNKSYGFHTYANDEPVRETDVYDLASVTKISATTIAVMKMISDRKMSLNDPLGKFFKDTKIDYTRIKPDTLINIDTFFKSTIINWEKFLKDKDTANINDTSFAVIDTVIYKLTPRLNIFKVPLIDLLKHQSGIAPALPIFRYMYYKAYYVKHMKEQFTALHGKTGPLFDFRSFELPDNFPENTKLADSLKSRINKGFKMQYDEYFSTKYVKDSSDIRLTDNLFLRNKYFDTIWRDTKQLPVYGRKVFIYSDINMILLQMAIDSLNNKSIDDYLKKTIYNPLGLKSISYLPLNYYPRSQIIPTELEKAFRYGYLHGYVHDPSAALLGGMAGNAGLYSNAHDLGVLFQMILNKGSYGGIKYINPAVIKQFTTRLDETQRGLGFDMPNRKAKVGNKAPQSTFGHSGYTGTCVWVDPENEIVYVFLANRNHPNATNWRINSQNVRERVHNAIYNALTNKRGGNAVLKQKINP